MDLSSWVPTREASQLGPPASSSICIDSRSTRSHFAAVHRMMKRKRSLNGHEVEEHPLAIELNENQRQLRAQRAKVAPLCRFFRNGVPCPYETSPNGCSFRHEKPTSVYRINCFWFKHYDPRWTCQQPRLATRTTSSCLFNKHSHAQQASLRPSLASTSRASEQHLSEWRSRWRARVGVRVLACALWWGMGMSNGIVPCVKSVSRTQLW